MSDVVIGIRDHGVISNGRVLAAKVIHDKGSTCRMSETHA